MIEGLSIIENFETNENIITLLENINKCKWNKEISRDTMHFGKRYNYSTRSLEDTVPIPDWFNGINSKIEKIFGKEVEQIIINKYKTGQGIAPHIDHTGHFGSIIASFSINAEVPLIMSRSGFETETYMMKHASLAVLKDDARYKWKHSLKNNTDKTRISITFRTLKKT